MNRRAKELYVRLDLIGMDEEGNYYYYDTYMDTLNKINEGYDIIRTTQIEFLSFRYAERLFVVVNGETHEITLGECEGTNREIRESHNLPRMLIAGHFDWFR